MVSPTEDPNLFRVVHNGSQYCVTKHQITGRQMNQLTNQELKVVLIRLSVPQFKLRPPGPVPVMTTLHKETGTNSGPKDHFQCTHDQTMELEHTAQLSLTASEDWLQKSSKSDATGKRKLRSNSAINNRCELEVSEKRTKSENNDKDGSKKKNSSLKSDKRKKNKENRIKFNSQLSRVIGLPNMGNTCYLNSIIQVLRVTPGFKQFICKLNNEMVRNKSSDKLKPSDKELIKTLHEVFVSFGHNMANEEEVPSETHISNLVDSENIKERFESGQQQDCHEFLNWLTNELNSYAELIFANKSIRNGYKLRTNGNEAKPTFESFRGIMLRKITCSECMHCSVTDDWFEDIQIPLCDTEQISDLDHLRSFTDLIHRKDYLRDDNKFDCRKCSKKTNALVVNSIKKAPEVLIIYIKKPLNYSQMITRNARPSRKLFKASKCLEYSSDQKTYRYVLYALVMHRGSDADNGHYYAVINSTGLCPTRGRPKHQSSPAVDTKKCKCLVNALANNGWIRVDDNKVSKISDNHINKLLDDENIASTPYLAFYHQIKT